MTKMERPGRSALRGALAACALAAGALGAGAAFAQATPAGLWKTIDDETKQEKSFVRIVDGGGTLTGRIERILDPTKADAKCDKCEGARKDQKVLGMAIIEGVKRDAGHDHWDGGTILDPNNGKVYKVRLTPKDGGKVLEVRGYVGMPMIGRTQTWVRVE
ncbi:MAG: hypothetical protein RI988_1242 [Pseudomonadota bacterium]|jgi:uncharacterized protein (DUF2147 family)